MKILIIDNYDSFTYNLYQYTGEILKAGGKPFQIHVKRNDEMTTAAIQKAKYDHIIISPGPGDPSDRKYFGVCAEILAKPGETIPVLGVCLGMQGMAYYFGGRVVRARRPMHGKMSTIQHDGKGIFTGLPQGLSVMRYHSLVAQRESLPECLEITAEAENDPSFAKATAGKEIMGLRHRTYPIEGIQFHPESFATEGGKKMLRNFLFNL